MVLLIILLLCALWAFCVSTYGGNHGWSPITVWLVVIGGAFLIGALL